MLFCEKCYLLVLLCDVIIAELHKKWQKSVTKSCDQRINLKQKNGWS